MQKLIDGQKLESKHRDHFLTGEYEGYKECHFKNDLLLIYEIDKEKMMITFINVGSHQELFG